MKSLPPAIAALEVIFAPSDAAPPQPVRVQVERVHLAVGVAEVVDPVDDDRRRLDRRAGVPAPLQAPVRAVEDVDPAAHRVVDDLVPDDGRRRRHARPAGRAVHPGELAGAHRDRVDGRGGVPDVREAVVRRRPGTRSGGRGRGSRRGGTAAAGWISVGAWVRACRRAVERPLQARLVDADRLLAAGAGSRRGRGRTCSRAPRPRPRAAPRGAMISSRRAGSVRAGLAPEPHARAAHALTPVAVEDRDDELRRLRSACRCVRFGLAVASDA